MSKLIWRPMMPAPDLTPADIQDPEQLSTQDAAGIGPDGTRTISMPLAPVVEQRILIANRVTGVFTPGATYANTDPQRGGAPGDPGTVMGSHSTGITSESPTGVDTAAGVPVSQLKLSMADQDVADFWPTWIAGHTAVNANANPNRPQVNPRPFNNEGPQANTKYATPAPWAAGSYIG
jgi:hypothetical protein